MTSINNVIINKKITNFFQKYEFEINKVNNNIENIKKFTNILDIERINKLDYNTNDNINILYYLKAYEEIVKVNDYAFCKCP